MSAGECSSLEARIAIFDGLLRDAIGQLRPGMSRKEERQLVRAAAVYRKESEKLEAQLAKQHDRNP